MRRFDSIAFLGLLAVTVCLSSGRVPTTLATSVDQSPAIEIPTIPDPASVQLDAKTTAFLALDFTDRICGPQPKCVATLPAVQGGLMAARTAHALVVYSVTPGGTVLSDIAPQGEDPLLTFGPDKFFNTNLDETLKQAGIATLVITGTYASGAVLYTSFVAARLGYTVVVAQDGISSPTDFATYSVRYQLLTGPGTSNPDNTPLRPKAVTLSRTDLIAYR